jgi:hypothetical protein
MTSSLLGALGVSFFRRQAWNLHKVSAYGVATPAGYSQDFCNLALDQAGRGAHLRA